LIFSMIIHMMYPMQIAVTVPDDQVDEMDRLIPSVFRSRAEVVRVALDDLLAAHRRQLIDEQYSHALGAVPEHAVPHRLEAGDPEPGAWASVPW
jgi:Arc/MetJ-type ribon-helix-helix transcriptional regulator